jgi:hypothetical protein
MSTKPQKLFVKSTRVIKDQEVSTVSRSKRDQTKDIPQVLPKEEAIPKAVTGEEKKEDDQSKTSALYQTLKYVKKTLTTSTLHRLGSIFDNESLLGAIIMALFFLTSAGVCMYYCIQTIVYYAQMNVGTSGATYYETPAEFPGKFKTNITNQATITYSGVIDVVI